MENIYETDASFPFDKLILLSPTALSGGNYFIKYQINKMPLYIQPPKCKTRNGIHMGGTTTNIGSTPLKMNKRMHCDLMFSNEDESLIRWMEDLETHTCRQLYENREKWFETDMDMNDIENYFCSPLKSYKSGKFHLARSNIPTRLGKITLKIYDEDENDVLPDSIDENTEMITILEVQGIKCSARSFQIEIEMKQMMTVKPSNLFDHYILRKPAAVTSMTASVSVQSQEEPTQIMKEYVEPDTNRPLPEEKDESINTMEIYEESDKEPESENRPNEFSIIAGPHSDDLMEFNLDLDELPETEMVHIKARNEVYYEMYREARKKAKLAKQMALSAYLEAKQIKNTYMLDDIEESDSDIDEEVDATFSQNTT
jgi:hypothetical protein